MKKNPFLIFSICLFSFSVAYAKMGLPSLSSKSPEVNDQPAPGNSRVSVVGNGVTLTWVWQMPEQHPDFSTLGFEVERQDEKRWVVPSTTFSDFGLAFGTYTYRVRALGEAKERGQRLMHVSDWTDPVQATIDVTCSGPPVVRLAVESVQHANGDLPGLRLYLSGDIAVPKGCQLTNTTYRIDSTKGTSRTGHLPVDAKGRYNVYVEAVSPDEEAPTVQTVYTASVIAEDEAGPVTSNTFSVNLEPRNPFAPKSSD